MRFRHWVLLGGVALMASSQTGLGQTAVALYGGSHSSWPTVSWIPLTGLADPVDAGVVGKLDFVGDAGSPGAFWSQDSGYLYFRMQLNVASIQAGVTYADTLLILIDKTGQGTPGVPDFGFAWDSKGSGNQHGLEMQVLASASTTWGSVQMGDVDGSPGLKTAPPDFRLTGGDGYLRAVTDTGTGRSYIDWAVSWNFLENVSGTGLGRGQTWSIAFGSIQNQTDHSPINADVAGGAAIDSLLSAGWSESVVVPEPRSIGLLGLGAILASLGLRRDRRS